MSSKKLSAGAKQKPVVVSPVGKAVNSTLKKWLKLNHIASTCVGLSEYIDTLVPETADTMVERINVLKDAKKDIQKLRPQGREEERTVRLFNYLVEKWRIELEDIRYWEKAPLVTEYVIESLYPLIAIDYAPLAERIEHLHNRLKLMPKRIREIWRRIKTPSRVLIEMELEAITRLPGFFFYLQEVAREGARSRLYRDIHRLTEECLDEVQDMCHHLIVRVLNKDDDHAFMQPEVYDCYLRHLLQRKDIPAVLASAETSLDTLFKRLSYIGNRIARRQSVDLISAQLKEIRSANIHELLQFSKEVATKALEFVRDNSFCRTTKDDTLYVLEEPSYYVQYAPLYLYKNGGNFSRSDKGFVFFAAPDCDLDKLRELNQPFVTAMTTRLSYPGRHLYSMCNKGYASLLESLNDAHFTVSGWGEYSAIKLNELGFEDTPQHAFMNTMALIRANAKFVTEIKLFRGMLRIKEAVAYLARNSCFDWSITEAEVYNIVGHPGSELYAWYGYELINSIEKQFRNDLKSQFKQSSFNNFLIALANYPIQLLAPSDLVLSRRPPQFQRVQAAV